MRRLALGLVSDKHTADDLVQKTYLYALESPPQRMGTPRSWLRKVMRHLAINQSTSERRRRDREALVAREDVQQPRVSYAERHEVQNQLAVAVSELAEPYRTAVVLRYMEDFAPGDIARKTAVPIETVKTRLKRARAQLRESLDREHGGESRRWTLPLMAFIRQGDVALPPSPARASGSSEALPSAGAPHTTMPRTLGSSAWLRGLAAVAVTLSLLTGIRLVTAERADSPRSVEAFDAGPLSSASLDTTSASQPPNSERPVSVEREATPQPAPLDGVVDPGFDIECRVVDQAGRALSNVRVVFVPTETQEKPRTPASSGPMSTEGDFATTDEDGVTLLTGLHGWGHITTDSEDWLTFLPAYVHGYSPADGVILMVGEPTVLLGRVVDTSGTPLEDVEVSLIRNAEFKLPERADQLYTYENSPLVARTDSGGRFELVAASLEHVGLRFRKRGFAYELRSMPKSRGSAMHVVLQPQQVSNHAHARRAEGAPPERWVHGVVQDLSGMPLANATVSAGNTIHLSDRDGRFSLRVDELQRLTWALSRYSAGEGVLIHATLEGYAADSVRLDTHWGEGPVEAPEVVLELGRTSAQLSGKVVDPHGRPLAGVEVWAADLTCMSVAGVRGLSVEGASAGLDRLDITTQRSTYLRAALTDDEGEFQLTNLLDRPYRLKALDPESGARAQAGPFTPGTAGGSAARLTLNPEALWDEVTGTVRLRDGSPVTRAVVWLVAEEQELLHGEGAIGIRPTVIDRTSTRGDGSFRLERVPREGAYLIVSGDEVFHANFGRQGQTPLWDPVATSSPSLELTVPRRIQAELTLLDPLEADSLRAFLTDDPTEALTITRAKPRIPFLFLSDNVYSLTKSPVALWIPDAPTTLVLYSGTEEVRRVELPATRENQLTLEL